MPLSIFTKSELPTICDTLAKQDVDLQTIVDAYGYPPFWSRPNTFETLVHIILEQQVSLASAAATLEKLRRKIGNVTPENVLMLSDEDLRDAAFSRQKTAYVRHLGEAIVGGRLDLERLGRASNEEIRDTLIQIKGIGNWTIDIYLIMVLHRADIFPTGDLAAVAALKTVKHLDVTPAEVVATITDAWAPHRTVATMLLWHHYLSVRRKPEQAPPV